MGRAVATATVVALACLTATPVAAHPGPTDERGGHICRPEGGGASDCTQFGMEPGEYHCHQEPCFREFQRTGRTWCTHGLPVPIRSDGVGVFPVGDFTPPIRVDRLDGPGHVLEVDRSIEPKIQAPQDCLGEGAVLLPDEGLGPDDRAGFTGAEPVQAASADLERLTHGSRHGTPSGTPVVLVAALGLLVLGGRRRPTAYWETGSGPVRG